jgi:hypothetical protein
LHASSRQSATVVEEQSLKATLISREVMQWYSRGEKKLQHELKQICLDDHSWFLKSWDLNGVDIVKVHCAECVKDFGGSNGDHTKGAINNLFSNFRKSRVMSTAHIRSWCRRKDVDFYDHPQSAATKGKSVVMAVDDHRKAIKEGLETMNCVNDKSTSKTKPFTALGDPDSMDVKCFWYKVRCVYCNDVFTLCPPKKNLEVNLMNHIGGRKHEKIVAGADSP